MDLGLAALDIRRSRLVEMEEHQPMMNRKISKVLLLQLLVKTSRVLDSALVQQLLITYHHPLHPHTSTDHLPTPIPTVIFQDHPDEVIISGTPLAQAGMAPIFIVMKEVMVLDMNVVDMNVVGG